MAHRVHSFHFDPPFEAVLTMISQNGERSIVHKQMVAQLPEAIRILNVEILHRLKVEEGKMPSPKILYHLQAQIHYPEKTRKYLESIKDEIIIQITFNRFILLHMEESKHVKQKKWKHSRNPQTRFNCFTSFLSNKHFSTDIISCLHIILFLCANSFHLLNFFFFSSSFTLTKLPTETTSIPKSLSNQTTSLAQQTVTTAIVRTSLDEATSIPQQQSSYDGLP